MTPSRWSQTTRIAALLAAGALTAAGIGICRGWEHVQPILGLPHPTTTETPPDLTLPPASPVTRTTLTPPEVPSP